MNIKNIYSSIKDKADDVKLSAKQKIIGTVGATPINAQTSPCYDPIIIGYAQFVPTCLSNNVLQIDMNTLSTENPNDLEKITSGSFTSPSINSWVNAPALWQKTVNGDTYTGQTFNQLFSIRAGNTGIFEFDISDFTTPIGIRYGDVGGNYYNGTMSAPTVVPEPSPGVTLPLGVAILGGAMLYRNRKQNMPEPTKK